MPAERFYIEELFKEGLLVTLKDQEAHHMVKVMRHKSGDRVELINGKNERAIAEICAIQRAHVDLKICEYFLYPEKKGRIILAQALPRLNRLETIVEKCTELDVDEIWLFPGDLSEKKELSENQRDRMRTIAISAIKQCGRLTLPEIIYKKPLKQWKKEELLYLSFFGDVSDAAKPFKEYLSLAENQIIFFVGPEAGFSTKEESLLKSLGSTGVKLHHNILRTDTAPIVALSLIQHAFL